MAVKAFDSIIRFTVHMTATSAVKGLFWDKQKAMKRGCRKTQYKTVRCYYVELCLPVWSFISRLNLCCRVASWAMLYWLLRLPASTPQFSTIPQTGSHLTLSLGAFCNSGTFLEAQANETRLPASFTVTSLLIGGESQTSSKATISTSCSSSAHGIQSHDDLVSGKQTIGHNCAIDQTEEKTLRKFVSLILCHGASYRVVGLESAYPL